MKAHHKTDILIIGAGPVGLSLACFLAANNIGFIICDKAQTPALDLKASTFHPPTLDMLAPLGLSDQLIKAGLKVPHWQIRFHETGRRAVFDLSSLAGDTDFPFRLQCEQAQLCRFAAEHLAQSGHEILRGAEAQMISQDEEHVITRLASTGGDIQISSRYVVGADGAQSLVRTYVDPNFEGLTYPETTILATTRFPFEDHLDGLSYVNYIWWERGTFSLLKLPHLWRCSLYPDPDETLDEAAQIEAIRRKLGRIAPPAAQADIMEIRPYRIHMKVARQFVNHRIIIIGDAAHLNSPSGGMGMNGGIHDAHMLARAIARVLAGDDEDALARFAEARRQTVEHDIVAQADKNRARMQETDPHRRKKIFTDLKRVAETPDLAREYLLKSAMIDGLKKAEAIYAQH